jgi:hypothetical protein
VKKLDLDLAFVENSCIGLGIGLYTAFHKTCPAPMAFCWGIGYDTENGARFDVFGRFTPVEFRRQGLQTLIDAKLFEHYAVITTCAGTREGTKFMQHDGYKYNRNTRIWYKERSDGNR